MKILYIALKFDNGDPARGYSFEHYNFYDSLLKMDQSKHEIIYFAFDEIMQAEDRRKMNQLLLETVRNVQPQLCFFALFTDEILKETIREITAMPNITTFNWFADDHWRFHNFSKHYAPFFSFVGTTDSQALAKYQAIGYQNALKTQWACNHFLYKPDLSGSMDGQNSQKIYPLTFVGQPHADRKQVVNYLEKQGIEVQAYGRGWPNGRISQEEMIKIFSQSQINLNLTKSSLSFDIKSILRLFLSRRSSGRITFNSATQIIDSARTIFAPMREQIKGRTFEIPGTAGFLLSGNADNLEEYYIPEKEICVFSSQEEMAQKSKYYLDHQTERQNIAKAGYERTLRDHTYEIRFRELFKKMGLK